MTVYEFGLLTAGFIGGILAHAIHIMTTGKK